MMANNTWSKETSFTPENWEIVLRDIRAIVDCCTEEEVIMVADSDAFCVVQKGGPHGALVICSGHSPDDKGFQIPVPEYWVGRVTAACISYLKHRWPFHFGELSDGCGYAEDWAGGVGLANDALPHYNGSIRAPSEIEKKTKPWDYASCCGCGESPCSCPIVTIPAASSIIASYTTYADSTKVDKLSYCLTCNEHLSRCLCP